MNVAQALGGAGGFSAPSMDPFEVLRSDYDPNAPPKPAPPPATIRPFLASTDLKIVRYLVGASVMEPSSLANQAALFKPLIVLLWAGLTHLLIVYVGRGWPTSVHNLFASVPKEPLGDGGYMQTATEWLSLTPLIVVAPIVLLALFEMRHRSMFEDKMSRAIGEEDMRDIEEYYAVGQRDGKQGFWVLEYDGRIIGAMGLDGRKPGQQLDAAVDHAKTDDDKKIEDAPSTDSTDAASTSATTSSPYPLRSRGKVSTDPKPSLSVTPPTPALGTSTTTTLSSLPSGTLHLRRLATSLSFRPAHIEDDLLSFVGEYAFGKETGQEENKQIVITLRPAVEKNLAKRLKKNGFVAVPKGAESEVVGVDAQQAKAGIVAALWPLDLSARTFVLTREQWEKQVAQAKKE
ncbi:hypothetical protein BCR35DRAFT_308739 [Leucosporidium creatinivorum]|uniref:Uncharacterized protein n=1 Tax=Leucosporidium creatinivorum TaxID=106004 RepID=A0A1Y2DZV6_9BASI|nr:hypothetical protein BCR35DRAFT_308739 [Leucosporidium creatinivorum]